MLQSILFFAVSLIVGLTILARLRIFGHMAVPFLALLVGSVVSVVYLFILGTVVPVTTIGVTVELVFLAGVALVILSRDSMEVLVSVKHLVQKQFNIYDLMGVSGLVGLIGWLFTRALFIGENGEIIAGDRLVWVDWPLHIGMAANFAWGGNIPPQNPTFAGTPLIYPFFSDFLSGMLLSLGAPLNEAFSLPGFVLIVAFGLLYIFLGKDILYDTFSRGQKSDQRLVSVLAFTAVFICLFWGGLGFVYWTQEAMTSPTGWQQILIKPPREYTFWAEQNFWFFTFLYSEILPQRAFVFGLPMFFAILIFLKTGLDHTLKPNFFVAGILGGLLPFFHTHTFLSLWILMLTFFTITGVYVFRFNESYKRRYLEAAFLFFLPFGVLSLLQVPFFAGGRKLPFVFGWMKGEENFFVFWFKNTGFFLPLMLLGLIKGPFRPVVKAFGWASLSLFIVPNLFHFAPWGYDNLKMFTYWYLIGAWFVAWSLYFLSKKGILGKIVSAALLVSLVLSGLIEVSRIVETSRVQITLWSREDQEFAQKVKELTEPTGVFLTAAIHDHPVTALAGRKIVLGFPGNSWSWGIAGWDTRERDVKTMFRGGDEALALWKKYNIDYIIVSERERWFEPDLDEKFIENNSELVTTEGKYRLYKRK